MGRLSQELYYKHKAEIKKEERRVYNELYYKENYPLNKYKLNERRRELRNENKDENNRKRRELWKLKQINAKIDLKTNR